MLGGHKDFLLAQRFEKSFLLLIRTAFEKGLCLPVSIETEPKLRVFLTHLHRLVDHAAMKLRKFCLKIGIPDVQMLMRHEKDGPPFCRPERLRKSEVLRVEFYVDP